MLGRRRRGLFLSPAMVTTMEQRLVKPAMEAPASRNAGSGDLESGSYPPECGSTRARAQRAARAKPSLPPPPPLPRLVLPRQRRNDRRTAEGPLHDAPLSPAVRSPPRRRRRLCNTSSSSSCSCSCSGPCGAQQRSAAALKPATPSTTPVVRSLHLLIPSNPDVLPACGGGLARMVGGSSARGPETAGYIRFL